ncbi:MAG TPA: ABC transporter permease [Bryobacteraceae bacterium]|nr:ABC transporter permease [Bryobacteraceae bacterium]
MLSDLRIALRTLQRSPGFASVAIAALALGIGANTGIFSIVNALLLHPAGIANPERVVAVRVRYYKLNLMSIGPSAPDLGDVRDNRALFEHAALWNDADFNYAGRDLPERLQGAVVSAEYFDVFGAKPRLGRLFRPEEDQPKANRVVVLSYAAWMRVFGGDPALVGKTVELNQTPYRVIGIMNPEFRWPRAVDLWAPIGLAPKEYTEGNRFNENYTGVARLRSNVSLARANAGIQMMSDHVRKNGTQGGKYAQDSLWGMFAVPFTDFAVGDTKTPTLVLLAAVGLVLLIVCTNIAGLMLARTAARTREIAVRTALGASRWQIMRQTAGESVILAAAGALLGIATAKAGVRALLMLAPERAVEGVSVPLDVHVLGFALLVTLVSAVLFSMAPAWQGTRISCSDALKEGGRSGTGARRRNLRSVLVVSEMALAVVLLVGAGLFLRALARIERVSAGFRPEGVLTAKLTLPEAQYNSSEKQAAFIDGVTKRLAQTPGAMQAAAVIPLPFSGGEASASFGIVGRAIAPGDPGPHGNFAGITPDYFAVMGIPLLRGRTFTDQDRLGTEPVTVIDTNLARQYWPNEDPIGQKIKWDTTRRIVGIVNHVRRSSLSGDESKGMYYVPLKQSPVPFMWLAVKTSLDPAAMSGALQAAVHDTDPAQPVHDIKTLADLVSASLAPRRFVADILSFFAAVALALAALGLYGLISYSVAQQTPEIGIRMALGAEPRSVLMHVVGGGLRLTLYGAVIGALAVIPMVRLLGNALEGVSMFEPWIMIGTTGLLGAAALLACYIPALRATRIDPMEALRFE